VARMAARLSRALAMPGQRRRRLVVTKQVAIKVAVTRGLAMAAATTGVRVLALPRRRRFRPLLAALRQVMSPRARPRLVARERRAARVPGRGPARRGQ
jgi:hypothetical protein